ncbi:MAG: glucose-6-phosphate isomerase [Solobacterium sp.]|nr:glucose-6-phosphate isomerase [Solobacterium sp.]
MITLNVKGLKPEFEQELNEILAANTEVLAKAQAGEEKYSDSLGWLDTEEWADDETVARIEAIAKEVQENADAFVLIGVGGSNNAARSVIEAIQKPGTTEIIYAGNTLSANALNRMLAQLEGKDFYIDCIAKNFETLEPGSSFRILRKALKAKYGDEYNKRVIATGTRGSRLDEVCQENGYTFIDFPTTIGGRYTAISNVGLLPMAVAGIDIREVRRGARDMQELLRSAGADQNIAYRYAALRNLYYRHGWKVEMLSSFEPQFKNFFYWWTQLFAESEGKDFKGIFPVTGEFTEQLHSIGQYIQDGENMIFETFLDVKEQQDSLVIEKDEVDDRFDYLNGKDFFDINKAAYEATVLAHSQKFPCNVIQIDRIDAYHFGQLFWFFQFACYVSCGITGVNPFDQPGVEAYKVRMFDALGK